MKKDISVDAKRVFVAIFYVLAILMVGAFARYVVNQVYPSTPEYKASMLDTVFNDERFSVKLPSSATIDPEVTSAANSQLSEHGINVNGAIYRANILNDKASIQAGCMRYTFNGDTERYIASREAVDGAADGQKQQLEKSGYTVSELSRVYDDAPNVYSVILELEVSKGDSSLSVKNRTSMKGNVMCNVFASAPDKRTSNELYSDVYKSFVYKW